MAADFQRAVNAFLANHSSPNSKRSPVKKKSYSRRAVDAREARLKVQLSLARENVRNMSEILTDKTAELADQREASEELAMKQARIIRQLRNELELRVDRFNSWNRITNERDSAWKRLEELQGIIRTQNLMLRRKDDEIDDVTKKYRELVKTTDQMQRQMLHRVDPPSGFTKASGPDTLHGHTLMLAPRDQDE